MQQQVRRKVELARSLLLARISVILRRLHQQHPEKLTADKVPRVAGSQGAMLLDRRAYLAAFLEVVDESNVDGEHAIWNQFCFDRLLVLDLDLSVSANGDYELQELVRLVLARMGEQLPLDQVLAHVLHEHGADRLADMRDAIRDVLSSSRHQVRGNPRSNPTTDPNPNPYCSRPRATRSLSEST